MSLFTISKLVMKSLFRKPATRLYPFEERVYKPGTRGSIRLQKELCIYCGICKNKCPTSAIQVDKPAKTWSIDRLRCISCNYCVEVCPKKCLHGEPKQSGPTVTRDIEVF